MFRQYNFCFEDTQIDYCMICHQYIYVKNTFTREDAFVEFFLHYNYKSSAYSDRRDDNVILNLTWHLTVHYLNFSVGNSRNDKSKKGKVKL